MVERRGVIFWGYQNDLHVMMHIALSMMPGTYTALITARVPGCILRKVRMGTDTNHYKFTHILLSEVIIKGRTKI